MFVPGKPSHLIQCLWVGHLYHKILLVFIKTCILQKFCWILCFERDLLIFHQYRLDLMRSMRLTRLNDSSSSFAFTTDLVRSSNGIFCWMSQNSILLIERDETDREQYFFKIPFRSCERDGISQKHNLAHAWALPSNIRLACKTSQGKSDKHCTLLSSQRRRRSKQFLITLTPGRRSKPRTHQSRSGEDSSKPRIKKRKNCFF